MKKLLCLIMFSLLIHVSTNAQISINYPGASEDVLSCFSSSKLFIKITNTDPDADNIEVLIDLPAGIYYVEGSIDMIEASTGVTIEEENVSNLNKPIFKIEPGDLELGEFAHFSLDREGACEAHNALQAGEIFKDVVQVECDLGSFSESNPTVNSYSVLTNSISILYENGAASKDTLIYSIPSLIERKLQLSQNGLGSTQNVTYSIEIGDDILDYKLKWDGVEMEPTQSNGNTLIFELNDMEFPGIFGEGGVFSSGETVQFTECFEVDKCPPADYLIRHEVEWGCEGDKCDKETTLATVTLIVSTPSLDRGIVGDVTRPECTNGTEWEDIGFFFENTGNSAVILSFQIDFGNNHYGVNVGRRETIWNTETVEILIDGDDFSQTPDYTYTHPLACSNGLSSSKVNLARYESIELLPGQYMEVNAQFTYCCWELCPTSYLYYGLPNLSFQATNACEGNLYKNTLREYLYSYIGPSSSTITGPGGMSDGDIGTFCVNLQEIIPYPNESGSNEYILEITFPGGFSYVSGSSTVILNGDNLPFNVLQNSPLQITVDQSDLLNGTEVCFDLKYECGSPTIYQIEFDLYQIVSPGCSDECLINLLCKDISISTSCPSPTCDLGGGVTQSLSPRRSTIGYKDANDDRFWESNSLADPDDVRLDRMSPCDEMCIAIELTVTDGSNGPTWIGAQLQQIMTLPFFNSNGLYVEVYSDGQLIGTVAGVPASEVIGNLTFRYDVSASVLHDIDSDFPEFHVFDEGDSLHIEACYEFSPVLGAAMYNMQLLYNQNPPICTDNQNFTTTFYLSNDNFQTKDACNSQFGTIELISTSARVYRDNRYRRGCQGTLAQWAYVQLRGCTFSDAVDYYPNEFRPVMELGDFVMELKEEAELIWVRLLYENEIEYLDPYIETPTHNHYDLAELFKNNGGPVKFGEGQVVARIQALYEPNCNFDDSDDFYPAEREYSDPNCEIDYVNTSPDGWCWYIGAGDFSLSQQPVNVDIYEKQQCFILTSSNQNTGNWYNIDYTWLEVSSISSNLEVVNVSKDGGPTIEINSDGFYELGYHGNNSIAEIEICIEMDPCGQSELEVRFGWDCNDYPSDLFEVADCNFETAIFNLFPIPGKVELEITETPDLWYLCQEELIKITYNNSGIPDMHNPELVLTLPDGVEVINLMAGYPNQSGDIEYEMLTGILNGNEITFKLLDHSNFTGDFLPGAYSSIIEGDKQVLVEISLSVNCDFHPSNISLLMSPFAENPCGDQVIGSGNAVTEDIHVKALFANYDADPILDMPSELQGCQDLITLNVSYVIVGGSPQQGDTTRVLLPSGLLYLTNSYDCLSDPDHCLEFGSVSEGQNGGTSVNFYIPQEIPSGEVIEFEIQVFQDGSSQCDSSLEIIVLNTIDFPENDCNGITCDAKQLILGSDTAFITVEKTEVKFNFAEGSLEGGVYMVEAEVQIFGIGLPANEILIVEILCSSDSSVIGTIEINGPVNSGDAVIISDEFTEVCPPGDSSLIFIIQEEENCICDEIAIDIIPEVISCGIEIQMPEDSLFLCEGNHQFQLGVNVETDYDVDYIWTSDNGGEAYLNDLSIENPILSIPQGVTGIFNFELLVEGIGIDCQAIDSLILVIYERPEVNLEGPTQVCKNDLGFNFIGTPNNGIWSGPVDQTGFFDPLESGSGIHIIKYLFEDSNNCGDSSEISIEVFDTTQIFIDPVNALCISSGEIELFANPPGGEWSEPVNGNLFDPEDVGLGLAELEYIYTDENNCESRAQLVILIVDEIESSIEGPLELCSNDSLISYIGTLDGGEWGGVADFNGIVDPEELGAGTFEISYSSPPTDCSQEAIFSITIFDPPSATLADGTIVCNQGDMIQLNFNDLILIGDLDGNWEDLDESGAAGAFPILDFSGVEEGIYQFEYTTNSAEGPCSELSYLIDIVVENCECPSLAMSTPPILCQDNVLLDLNDIKITLETGTWSIISVPSGNNPGGLDDSEFSGIQIDTGSYVVQFVLDSVVDGCEDTVNIELIIVIATSAELVEEVTVCNVVDNDQYDNILDLNEMIIDGDITGSWEDIDNSGAVGAFNNLDFEGVEPGQYTFGYTTSAAIEPCENQSYYIEVIVLDCSCPIVDFNDPGPFCSDNLNFDLTELLNEDLVGTWELTDFPNGNNPGSIQNDIFIGSNIDFGTYELTFTLDMDIPEGCDSVFITFLDIVELQEAEIILSTQICNSDGNGGEVSVNFSEIVLQGNINGEWQDDDNSGATGNFPILNFEGIPAGQYTFSYSLDSDEPCDDLVYFLEIEVLDCDCPPLLFEDPNDLCNLQDALDLNDLIILANEGTWEIISEPVGSQPAAIFAESIFTSNNSDAGTYVILYTLTDPVDGCPESIEITINVFEYNSAGLGGLINSCIGKQGIVILFDLLINADDGGEWSQTNGVDIQEYFDAVNGSVLLDELESGVYDFTYLFENQGPCPESQATVQLVVHDSPIADAGEDQHISCSQPQVMIGGNGSTGAEIEFEWIGPNDFNSSTEFSIVDFAGQYILTVSNQLTGCSTSDTVQVIEEDEFITNVYIAKDDILCDEFGVGKIEVIEVEGGTEPYSYSLNGSGFSELHIWDNLEAGTYELIVEDAFGCQYFENIEINVAALVGIDLGPDQLLETCEPTIITPLLEISPDQIAEISWYINGELYCEGCNYINIDSPGNFFIEVILEDINGCIGKDSLTIIREELSCQIYIPNVFSPNDDGQNDIFYIQAGECTENIKTMRVYSRWGELIFDSRNIPFNDPYYGWDGTFKDQDVLPQVLVYYIEVSSSIENQCIRTIYYGDLTLVE